MDGRIKPFPRCATAVKRANHMLGCIRRGMENNAETMMMPFSKSLVVHLQLALTMFSGGHYPKKDIAEIERRFGYR